MSARLLLRLCFVLLSAAFLTSPLALGQDNAIRSAPLDQAVYAAPATTAREPANPSDPLNLPLSLESSETSSSARSNTTPPSAGRATTTIIGGLSVCVGAFLLFVWVTRRNLPKSLTPLPSEVLEVLGRAPINGRQHLQLIRLGRKLVLVCVTPQGVQAITEVTSADEVERLAGMCQQLKPNSVTASFREILAQPTANRGGTRREVRDA